MVSDHLFFVYPCLPWDNIKVDLNFILAGTFLMDVVISMLNFKIYKNLMSTNVLSY